MRKILLSDFFFLLILVIVVFVVYGKSINFQYTNFDDKELINKNNDIRQINKLFVTDCYYGDDTQYYRPVLNLSFLIESFLFKDNSKIYHITNIILYILSLFVIYIFLSELNFNKTILKFLILFCSVHPILSSVPVWIPARNDTLLTIFFLLSLINFISYIKTDEKKYLILHFLFFAISLFSKETAVLLIFIYPLLICCFNLKINKKQIINNCFFVIFLLFFYFVLRNKAVLSIHISVYFNNLLYYVKNIFVGFMLYIEKLVYPTNMPIAIYDLKPTIQTYIINLIVFFSLLYVYYKKITDRKIFIFAILFSLVAMLPTFAQEEYLFLTHRIIISLVGILILLTSVLEKLINKYHRIKIYFSVIFFFIFFLFAFCSFMQIEKYKDSFTFWINVYQESPKYHTACSGLANEYLSLKYYDKAIELLFESKKLKNTYDNDLDICTALIAKGDIDNAKERLLRLSELKDNFLVFRYLSEIFYVQGDLENSKIYADKALKIDSNDKTIIAHYKRLTDAINDKK